jgi:hypothetical protein
LFILLKIVNDLNYNNNNTNLDTDLLDDLDEIEEKIPLFKLKLGIAKSSPFAKQAINLYFGLTFFFVQKKLNNNET